ncbi:TPA: anthranilate phosphoribosyltransferase [Candidatus Galligastranaerophilus gallistercoris]|nr:anthranilate phosphoribosyltransferase [Candidatus Galligastranaerophilus gallistercoris]
MIIEALRKLISRQDLEREEIKTIMNEMMEGKMPSSQISAFLIALRMKGETIDEITSAVEVLKEKAKKLYLNKDVIDIVGTGGDRSNTFNISTAASFVVASGGVPVAKHGNRSASSKSGAADILEVLGANIDLDCHQNKIILDKLNICFMFAAKYNPLIKNVLQVRREIKVRTIFNALGPLINPSNAKMQLIGVYDKSLVVPIAHVMANLGVKSGMTLFGECGLDEASVVGKTFYARIKDNSVTTGEFTPEEFGIKPCGLEDISGGEPEENAEIMKNIFLGKESVERKNVVCLNAACAFLIADKVKSLKEGFEFAKSIIDKKEAYGLLMNFIEMTRRV